MPPSTLPRQESNTTLRRYLTRESGRAIAHPRSTYQTTLISRSSRLPPPPYPHPPPQLHQLLLAAIAPITLLLPNFPLQIKTSNFQPKLNSRTVIPACSSGSSVAPGNPLHQWCLLSAPHSGITILGFSTASTTCHLHTLQGAYSYLHSLFFRRVRQRRAQWSS